MRWSRAWRPAATNPDRGSFATALQAVQDELTPAQICPGEPGGLPGAIGRAVLATLLPARRPSHVTLNRLQSLCADHA